MQFIANRFVMFRKITTKQKPKRKAYFLISDCFLFCRLFLYDDHLANREAGVYSLYALEYPNREASQPAPLITARIVPLR